MSDYFEMQNDYADLLKSTQSSSLTTRQIKQKIQEYSGKYHVHFVYPVRHAIEVGQASTIANDAHLSNVKFAIDGLRRQEEDSSHRLTTAFHGIDNPANGAPGAGGAQGGAMDKMMQGMQAAGQQGMQAAGQLPQQLGQHLEKLTQGGPFKDLFKNIESIVKTAQHGGGGSNMSHDTDNNNDAAHHHKDHDHDDSKEHSKQEREKQVTVTSTEKPLTLTVNPSTDTGTGAGAGAPSTLASPPVSHDAAAPAAPIDAGLVAPDEGNPSDASEESLAAPSVDTASGGLGDPDTASTVHDTEESSVSGSRNYHNEAHW